MRVVSATRYLTMKRKIRKNVAAVFKRKSGLIRAAVLSLVLVLTSVFQGCAHHRQKPLAPFRPDVSKQIPSIWPVSRPGTRISSCFGEERSGGRIHKGLDIAAPRGTPVVVTAPGITSFTGTQRGYGNMVTVDHCNGFETIYAHLDAILTVRGAHLERGDALGHVGATGNATGPHLHYEIRREGVPVDPQRYLP